MAALGIGMGIVALIAPEESTTAGATAVAGAVLILLAIAVASGYLGIQLGGAVGLGIGVVLIVSGFVPDDHLLPEWARIVAGGAVAMASGGAMASGATKQEPETT